MEKLVNIHVHSNYSVYDGVQTPQDVINKTVQNNQGSVALTDHGSFSGLYQFQKAALKAGVKPLLGTEFYITDSLSQEKDNRAGRHLVMIAKNKKGWENLCEISWIGAQQDHFYYKPRITYQELFDHKDGLIISSACLAGPFANLLLNGKEQEADKLFDKFLDEFQDDFYAELQVHNIQEQKKYNDWLIEKANKKGVPLILTADAHYSNQQDSVVQKLMFEIRNDDIAEEGEFSNDLFLHSIQDYKNRNLFKYTDSQIEQWCSNTCLISDKVDFLIKEADHMLLPRQSFDEFKKLQELSKNGLAEHFKTDYDNCPSEYRARLEYELNLMWKKNMARYLLTLQDIIHWCKNEGNVSVGSSRGSAGGSLVLCCIGCISWCMDPIKNSLLFDRFVSEERLPSYMVKYEA